VTSSSAEAYLLAGRYRKAQCKVVMGGPHVSCLPDEALQHCDSVVIGEAESVWGQVIRDFENNALKKIYQGNPLDDFLTPVQDYFMKLSPRALSRLGINMIRGCKYHCDFCARPAVKLRYAPLGPVIELIKRMRQSRSHFIRRPMISFTRDNNIFSDPVQAKLFFKALIPLNIRWGASCSIDISFDDEALRLARESGCWFLYFGFETVHPERYEKTSSAEITSFKDYFKVIRKVRSFGIKVMGSFVLGLDEYRHLDYLRLLFFLLRARMYFAPLTILTPLPGTRLFEELKRERRLTTLDWGKYDFLFHVVFRPKHTSAFALMLWFLLIRVVSFYTSPFGLLIAVVPYLVYKVAFMAAQYCVQLF